MEKVEIETRRVISEIDEMFETPRISVKEKLFFDEKIYPLITDMCLKGVVEAYNSTLKNAFQTGTRRQKRECLELYKKIFQTIFP